MTTPKYWLICNLSVVQNFTDCTLCFLVRYLTKGGKSHVTKHFPANKQTNKQTNKQNIKAFFIFFLITTSQLVSANPFESSAPFEAYPLRNAIWPTNTINVCWEDINYNATWRNVVRNAVRKTWESHSQLRFRGWNECPAGNFDGLRIFVGDYVHPKVNGTFGRHLRGVRDGIQLTFGFRANTIRGCPRLHGTRNCIAWIAAHEFGHAIGLRHEQARPDTPKWCDDLLPDESVPNDGLLFTNWDRDSIMNYCNPRYNGFGRLSDIDIQAVQTFYGNIPRYHMNTKRLIIPVVRIGGRRYTATLRYDDFRNALVLTRLSRTNNRSSQAAVYHPQSKIVSLPMVKFLRSSDVNDVVSLYSGTLAFDGSVYRIRGLTKIQPLN